MSFEQCRGEKASVKRTFSPFHTTFLVGYTTFMIHLEEIPPEQPQRPTPAEHPPQLLETLCLLHRVPQRVEQHRARMAAALAAMNAPSRRALSALDGPLVELLRDAPPPTADRERLRLVYDGVGHYAWTLHPYTPRPVRTLRLLAADHLDYAHKWADRRALDACFAARAGADDVLLVRHGRLTDTTIANVALWDGHHWCTPADPLLRGTHRAHLLERGLIVERDLTPTDLASCLRLRLFNAMLAWGEIDLPISAVLL